jgi:hypothetical protein
MFLVKVGNPDYSKATAAIRSEMVVIHPSFTPLDAFRHRHDIALIKVCWLSFCRFVFVDV